MLVARSPPPPPLGVSVAKHRAPVLQTCGLGRASSDTSKNFRFEVQTCSWKTVIGASCPPAPQSYRCHVLLTEPRGSANQIISYIVGIVNFAFRRNQRDFDALMLLSAVSYAGALFVRTTLNLLILMRKADQGFSLAFGLFDRNTLYYNFGCEDLNRQPQ